MIPRLPRTYPVSSASALPDAAVTIATAFNREGIAAVLTGTAAAAIHTRGRAACRALNYSLTSGVTIARLAAALRHLGFDPEPSGGVHQHLDAGFVLCLTQAPLSLGQDQNVLAQTLQLRNGFVRILSPTDCCRECLLAWKIMRDENDLRRAATLAAACDISMTAMRAWMRSEHLGNSWFAFCRLVSPSHAQPSSVKASSMSSTSSLPARSSIAATSNRTGRSSRPLRDR